MDTGKKHKCVFTRAVVLCWGWGSVLLKQSAAYGVVKRWICAAEEVVFCESCTSEHLLNSGDMDIRTTMGCTGYCEFIRLKRKMLKEVRRKHSSSLKRLSAGTKVMEGSHTAPLHHSLPPYSPFYRMNRLNE